MTPRKLSLLLAPALLAATATTALAQPAATDPEVPPTVVAAAAEPAPQTNSWDEVSHINGQLVPVGETNSYLKKYRRTNISINPVGMIVGIFGVSASYGLNDHIALRGDVDLYRMVDSNTTGSEIGVGVPIYLRRTYQGAFVEPGFIARHFQDNNDYAYDCYDCGSSESKTVGLQVLVGWHSTWDSGFNVAAAFGFGRNLNASTDSGDQLFANGYFRVGYAF